MIGTSNSQDRRLPRGIFLNTAKANCSIFESGRMVYECIMHSDRYTLDYLSVDMFDTALFGESGLILRTDGKADGKAYRPDYDFWVFNWHFITMEMVLPIKVLSLLRGIKFSIVLELAPDDPLRLSPSGAFDGYIALEPNVVRTTSIFPFPRPLEGAPRQAGSSTRLDRPPVIGSFGFDTPGKGFELLVEAVNREFDRATVRINVPFGTFSPTKIHATDYAMHIARVCREIAKPGIDVVFTHDFFEPEEVIDWCAGNDLNCFMYTRQQPGLSATTDQAILSGRPLLTLGNDTFRHIHRYISPYPEIGLKRAIETTAEAVGRMQRDWSKQRFRETFEEMLGSFGVLSVSPSAAVAALPSDRPTRVLHAHMDNGYQDDVRNYTRRLRDALSRTGNWQVTTEACKSLDELSAVAALSEAEIVVLSSVDDIDRKSLAEALGDVECPKIVVTNHVSAWSSSPFAAFPRRPIIPFYTVRSRLREGPPAVWLIGFGDPVSRLEQAVIKITSELPAAEIIVEASAVQRDSVAARIQSLRSAVTDRPLTHISIETLPVTGAQIIDTVASASLIVIHNDPGRADEIESYASLSMITERAVAFTRGAADVFGLHGLIFEDAAVPAMVAMGMRAQIKLLADLGEWQIAAGIRALCRDVQARKKGRQRRFDGAEQPPGRKTAKTADHILSIAGDGAFLHAAYRALLGRAPDSDGLAHFMSQLGNGRCRGSVLLEISLSQEAKDRGLKLPGIDAVSPNNTGRRRVLTRQSVRNMLSPPGTKAKGAAAYILSLPEDQDFLHAAYRELLGRTPDSEGLAHFMSQLSRGQRRGSVLMEISHSPEARDRGLDCPGIDAVRPKDDGRRMPLFERLFRPAVSRHATKNGGTAADILLLPEDHAFLSAAYGALLGREPDAVGRAHYLSQLGQGRRRDSVLIDISQSREARDRGINLPGLDDVARQERRAARSRELRETAFRRSLRAIDNRLYRLNVEAAAVGFPSPVPLAPLRFGTSLELPVSRPTFAPVLTSAATPSLAAEVDSPSVMQRTSEARNATDRSIFLLAGLCGGSDANLFEIRLLLESWRPYGIPRTVLWDSAERKFRVLGDNALFDAAHSSSDNLDRNACPPGSWLVVPQRPSADLDTTDLVEVDVIMEAHKLGLRAAFIFHGATSLRRLEDLGPSASACDRYIQALLLADLVLPVSHDVEDELVAVLTQHHLATWGPVMETVSWPKAEKSMSAWRDYVRAVDDLLSEVANPARRIKTLYYCVNEIAFPDQIYFALQLAGVLSAQGVSLIPTQWNAARGSLITASDTAALGSIPWGNWIEPGAAGAPDWILVPTGIAGSAGDVEFKALHGLRLAVLIANRSGESLVPATLSQSRWTELKALARADKVLALSESDYQGIYGFLLSWRGKVHSAEHRFKFLRGPDEYLQGTPRATGKGTSSIMKALLWAEGSSADVITRILAAAERAARSCASRLTLAVVTPCMTEVKIPRGLPWFEVSSCDAEKVSEAMADASFAIHPGSLRAREPEVIRCLWAGIPCIVSGSPSPGCPADRGTIQVDFDRDEAISEVIGQVLIESTIFRPTQCWVDFAQELLTELATDRLRDLCKPLRKVEKNVYEAFPNLPKRRPKLSVCLSTYNRAGWLKRNLENIYSQVSSERDDLEIFVVDNTSPDSTPEIVQPYLSRRNFCYHRNAKNVGMLGNLAVTAQRARGEYIWILGDDDLTRSGCINKVLDVLHQHPGIGLVYLNYGYTSEPDPLSITDLPAFLDAYNVLEPSGPDELGTVKGLAAKNENFYTAIYSHVYRRDHAIRSYCQDTSGRPFSTMLTCIPTSYYVLNYMPEESAYWIGEPSLVVNSRVSWVDYGTLFDLEQLPRAWDLAERSGANGKAVDQRRANRLWLVAMMWKEIFENDRAGNSPYFNAPRVLMRLKHLPEIERYVPEMREMYRRAYQAGHPAASMTPERLFSAFPMDMAVAAN